MTHKESFPLLNLPAAALKLRDLQGKKEVFDPIRRIYTLLTPEEWVRQHFLHYLIHSLEFPASLIAVEKSLKVHQRSRRFDLVVFDRNARARMLVECKATHVALNQKVLDQAGLYNIELKVPFLCVTNGFEHWCCRLDEKKWRFLDHIPTFAELEK